MCSLSAPCSGGVECEAQQGQASEGAENMFWYFREDTGLNNYHETWHKVNGNWESLRNDRRGELFYYFHRNLLAR